jgi:hypothetical protein
MMLSTTSTLVRVVTSSTADIDVFASWVDKTTTAATPGGAGAKITTATTTTIVPAPAASTQRGVISINIRNLHASTSNTVTVQVFDGTSSYEAWKGTLAAGEGVQFNGRFWADDPLVAVGPQGPAGPQGATGATGATGSDGWTYAKLGTDFNTTSATAVNVTGLSFTPSANTEYEFEGLLYQRTNTATVGPRPGCSWPTGLTDGMVRIDTPSSATANLVAMGNFNAAVLQAVGGLPNTTQSWPTWIKGGIRAGASPSGNFQIQLASETGGTAVFAMAGSFIRWRVIA